MDGPSVNYAFLDTLENYGKEEDPNAPSLLNIGSYGLHVLHGVYKTGHSEIDWDVDKTVKAVLGIFKHLPTRRAGFLQYYLDQYNDQVMKTLFSLKFCGHRLLENGKAIIRFMEILDKVTTYLTLSKRRKTWPTYHE